MIHEAYMPVYMGSRFLARAGGCTYGSTRGSTRGPRGPKNCDFALQKITASLHFIQQSNRSLSIFCGVHAT